MYQDLFKVEEQYNYLFHKGEKYLYELRTFRSVLNSFVFFLISFIVCLFLCLFLSFFLARFIDWLVLFRFPFHFVIILVI